MRSSFRCRRGSVLTTLLAASLVRSSTPIEDFGSRRRSRNSTRTRTRTHGKVDSSLGTSSLVGSSARPSTKESSSTFGSLGSSWPSGWGDRAIVRSLLGGAGMELIWRDTVDDLSSLDPELYKGLLVLKNYVGNVEEDLSLNFTVTEEGESPRPLPAREQC